MDPTGIPWETVEASLVAGRTLDKATSMLIHEEGYRLVSVSPRVLEKDGQAIELSVTVKS